MGILFKCIPHLSVVRKLLKYKKKHLQLSFSNRSFWTGEEVWGSDSMFTQYNELFYHKVFDSSWHDPCHFGFFDRLERTQEIFRESDKKRELAHNKSNILTIILIWKPHVSIALITTVILITNSRLFHITSQPSCVYVHACDDSSLITLRAKVHYTFHLSWLIHAF